MLGMKTALAAGALALCSTAALAVGLGPLEKSGVTATASKGLYLTLINPYDSAQRFRAYVEEDGAIDPARVDIRPGKLTMGANTRQRVLVVVRDLEPGEEVNFRVCAEKIEDKEVTVHARVCSKLGARRLGAAG